MSLKAQCCGGKIYRDPGGVEYPCDDCPDKPTTAGSETCNCPIICDSEGCRPFHCKGHHTPGCQRAPDIYPFGPKLEFP